jgi:hypothetical protein
MTRDRLLLASIHDVSPRFDGEIERLTNHWGDAPIIAGSNFASKLRAWADAGVEMFLHGFFHRDEVNHSTTTDRLRAGLMTAGEGEFLGLTKAEAMARIIDGKAIIEDLIGRPIAGFVAPAWLYGPGAHEALAECAIPIAEDHMRTWSPATGVELSRGPVITWASRTRLRLISSLAAAAALRHARLSVMRVGVHPPDVRHESIVMSIDATFRTAIKSRRVAAYSDLLAS